MDERAMEQMSEMASDLSPIIEKWATRLGRQGYEAATVITMLEHAFEFALIHDEDLSFEFEKETK